MARLNAFITRSGRHVPERDTDQAGSEMLFRTVSRYTDGRPTGRPQLCVSTEYTRGDAYIAQLTAEKLDARGFLPPAEPMSRDEWQRHVTEHRLDEHAGIVWDVCGRGYPIGYAISARKEQNVKSTRARIRRILNAIGWREREEPV